MKPVDRVREIVRMARELRAVEDEIEAGDASTDFEEVMDRYDQLAEQLVDHILHSATLAALAPVGGPFAQYPEGRA